jgi:glycosyltransferase involved in cell wall biosynthesis
MSSFAGMGHIDLLNELAVEPESRARPSVPDSPARHEGRVLHLVGRITDEVFSFLGPATAALNEAGVHQTVLLIDEARHRHLLPLFDPDVDLVFTPVHRNPVRKWGAFLEALQEMLASHRPTAVHLHGFLPCLIGTYALRKQSIAVPLYYSPHGSKSLVSFRALSAALLRWMAPVGDMPARASIAGRHGEGQTLSDLTHDAVRVIESPVDQDFFNVGRHETPRPLLVTGSGLHGPRGAELFAQLAVLLGANDLDLSFNWIGETDSLSAQRLAAAKVAVTGPFEPAERASRLAAGWIYVAVPGVRAFPLFLAEAMAAGLPCVAYDTPAHRDLIRDGETGFLCADPPALLSRIGQLIDSPELRTALGEAARAEAMKRFAAPQFRDSLMDAYHL